MTIRTAIRRSLLAAVALLALLASAPAQTDARPAIDPYIHSSWDTLTRSMAECRSVADIKVTTSPILYLPYGMAIPPAVAAMQAQCPRVQVAFLPRTIHRMGDVKIAEIPKEGLLYLPNPYVVPGGRFNEMYGWDSYFILRGLLQDGRTALARGMVENFFFEIANYGALLNANRTYYFTRSHPPLLSSMVREVYAKTGDKAWLAGAYDAATEDYSLWTRPDHLAGTTGLARYHDLGDGPVPEMADDSTYFPDVIRWFVAHPGVHPEYLVKASEHPDAAEAAQLRTTSCDLAASKVCAAAWAQGYRLSAAFFHSDRAMRESGFDTSFRFEPFSGSTDDFAPVCLNSLLYKYARDMAFFAHELGKSADETAWNGRAEARRAAIDKYLWHADQGLYFDLNFRTGKASTYQFISTFYPLWARAASPAQAAAVESHLALFEHDGGVAMSTNESGVQWDLPYGWAPTNWLTVLGLEQYGFHADAARISRNFMKSVETNYLHDGTIREKYNVVSADANVKVAAGYKSNVIGFGWTNGVYTSMEALLAGPVTELPVTPGPAAVLGREALEKLIPASVFFMGQTATTQLRNAAGIRFGSGGMLLAARVDTGGYATNVQERYQMYLLADTPVVLGDRTLPPGAYGAGFVSGKLVVMNLAGRELFSTDAPADPDLKRPMPLQITDDAGALRLRSGRSYVSLVHSDR